MYDYENYFISSGKKLICGIDEAGCGPLAGDVYAAAVILDPDFTIAGLNDSKKLSEKKRETLFDEIRKHSLYFGIAYASAQEIDEINILQARLLAMRRAFNKLGVSPDIVLVDGNRDPQIPDTETLCIVKGDALSASIAAASILAKVSRDRYMMQMDEKYPQYMFAKHKGYPTKLHYELLDKYGPCEIHRRSFLSKRGIK